MTEPLVASSPSSATIREKLMTARSIAVVGASERPERDSHRVMNFLRGQGYCVLPINPLLKEIDGLPVYPSLSALPKVPDLTVVFRRPEALPEIIDEALQVGAKALWLQLGVTHPESEARAIAAGLWLVSDRCILVESHRLGVPRVGPPQPPTSSSPRLTRA